MAKDKNPGLIRIGTAAWALPAKVRDGFPPGASNLARYAGIFNGTEINSSFYRSHQPSTYQRWADAVPPDFRFSVKMPRAITHEARLFDCEARLSQFLGEAGGLGDKLDCLLIQLPASFAFEAGVEFFFQALRKRYLGNAIFEPRHRSWFEAGADGLLQRYRICRAVADPPPLPLAAIPGGKHDVVYLRLHGSPRVYWSAYTPAQIANIARRMARLKERKIPAWCIFDNTASGAATENALQLRTSLAGG